MEENKQILLPSKEYAKSSETDLDFPLVLETSETLMRIGDRDIILDIDQLYDKERNDSVNYKIYGKLKMIFRNLYTGTTDYTYLTDRLYLVGDGTNNTDYTGYLPYDEFAFLRKDVYRQINVIASGNTPTSFVSNVVYTGSTEHQTITPINAPYHNWNLYLTYVYDQDINFPMTYTLSGATKTEGNNIIHFKSGNGIPFRISDTSGTVYELTCPVEHGMNQGEYVTLSGTTLTGNTLERTFRIDSVGNTTYNSEKYVINILKTQIPTGLTFTTLMIGARCLDITNISGSTSDYYVHKHKVLTDSYGYIMDTIGFETPIWRDEKKLLYENFSGQYDVLVERNRMESVLFDFKKPLQLSGITNNLGFTPTDVYVTTIFRNGSGFFVYPPKVGFKFNFHDTWIDNQFSGTTSNETLLSGNTFTSSGHTFTTGNTLSVGMSGLTGAFVEYNNKEFKERIISESFYKFYNDTTVFDYNQTSNPIQIDSTTNFSGASINNPIGLYHQGHHRVKLRQLSPYIETSKVKDIFNLPENAKYDFDLSVWRWRDLYDHGYVDTDGNGTNFPFVNGNHYVKADINFYLRNELYYTNKQDGAIGFDDVNNNKNKNALNC